MSRQQAPAEIYRMVGIEPETNGYHPLRDTLTDWGNAQRFVRDHGRNVRYCYAWGKWLIWDGTRWIIDDTGEVERLMKATVRGIYADAAEEEDEKTRKALAEHAKRSEAAKRIIDALRLARSEPYIPIKPEQLDADPFFLNAANGTIDLRTGELRAHTREDLITKIAPVKYHPDAQAPTFAAFLERILPSEALRRFVQRAIGYAAAGVVSEEILVILHGVGANGKSTLVNVVMEALGDYAMQAAPDLLLAKRDSHPTELADLFGARFVASVEVEEGRRLAESLVKQLTGRDPIKARRMREDFWQFDPTHTVFLATNHRPEVRGTDHAIWRRIKLVPFEVTIPEAEQDKKLPQKLRAELPGILAWAVRGCLEWKLDGLGPPEEVTAATESYRTEMDVLAAFIEDRCVVHPKASAGATPLYNAYKDWCDDNGEKWEKQTKFGLRLGERGFRREKAQRVTWHGIGLRDDSPDPESGDNRLKSESLMDKAGSADHDRRLDSPRPESRINTKNAAREDVNAEKGLQPSNRLQPSSEDAADTGDRLNPTPRGRALTPEQVERYKRLKAEGMSPEFARAAVLGEEVDVG